MGGLIGGQGGPCPPPSEKPKEPIGFLRNTSLDPLEKQLDPLGPIASKGRFIQPFVKYVDD